MTLGFENIGPLGTAIMYALTIIAIALFVGCAIGIILGHFDGKGNTKSYVGLFTKMSAVIGIGTAIMVFIILGINSNWFR